MNKVFKTILELIVSLFGGAKPASDPKKSPKFEHGMRIRNRVHIKGWEKLRLEAYKPTKNDKWTIGWGHTSSAYEGMKITATGAEALLDQDLQWVEAAIEDLVKVPVTQGQYDMLGSLIFNIGRSQFKTSTVLRKLNAGDYKGAADAFLLFNKQRNKSTGKLEELLGLTRRRKAERLDFLKATV